MNRAGMTLVELVVGLTITGLALGSGYAGFRTIVDHRERVDRTTAEVARAAALRRTLGLWLAGARLTIEEGGPEFRGLDGTRHDLPDDALSFLTTSATPLGERETIVQLFIDRDPATPERGLVAQYLAWPGRGMLREEIDSRVAGLDVRYLSTILGERRWLPSWITTSVLPAGVELRLIPARGDTLPPLLALPILVALEHGR